MRSVCADWLLQNGWRDLPASRGRKLTLTEHLCQLLRQAIGSQALRAGERLPATRDLMRELDVSRNTVTHAYEQLRMEGYVVSHVGSGTFVATLSPEELLKTPQRTARTSTALTDAHEFNVHASPELSLRAQRILQHGGAADRQWGAFMPGIPDVSAFPRGIYARILNRLWRHAQPEALTYGTTGGAEPLKKALAEYLQIARGVKCNPEQILITEGVHQAIDLAGRTLVNPNDCVWMEDPGYWGISNVMLMNSELQLIGCPVDAEGMTMPADAPVPKLICVTPSHQYPIGTVMSMARRKALLAYARAHRAWIVEDDYDSDFRFSSSPIPAMQGLEPSAPVIYIGTFSKTLFPSLRIGYMVLPIGLVDPMRRMHSELYRQGHALTHMALAEFISQGHYAKHIRRMRVLYGKRRAWLKSLIQRYLGSAFLGHDDSQAGLHLVLYLPDYVCDVVLTQELQSQGVLAQPLSKYFRNSISRKGLLLGYACVEESAMQKSFFVLLDVLRSRLLPQDIKKEIVSVV